MPSSAASVGARDLPLGPWLPSARPPRPRRGLLSPWLARVVLVLLMFMALLAAPAGAQAPTPPSPAPSPSLSPPAQAAPQGVSTEALRELVSALEDPVERERLVRQLRALLAAREAQEKPAEQRGLLRNLSALVAAVSSRLGESAARLVAQVGGLPERARGFWRRLQDPAQRGDILGAAARATAAVLAALLATAVVALLRRRPRQALAPPGGPPLRLRSRLGRTLALLGLDLLPPLALWAVAVLGLALAAPGPTAAALALALVLALALRASAGAAVQAVLAAEVPRLRMVPLTDDAARSLASALGRVLSLGIYGAFALAAVRAAGGEEALMDPLRNLYGLALLVAGILLVLRARRLLRFAGRWQPAAPSGGLASEPRAPARRWRASLGSLLAGWWVLALLYVVGLYAVWVSGAKGGFPFVVRASALTALWVAAAAIAARLGRAGLARAGARAAVLAAPLPSLAERLPRYLAAAGWVFTAAVLVLALGLALEAWGIAALAVLAAPGAREALSSLLWIAAVVVLAPAAADLASALAQRYLESREAAGLATGKVRTLVPLANKAIRVLLVFLVAITVLGQLGLEIGPILAGVGVLGLAVGFGAQTLVKDIITGVFILMEDTISVGDVVDVGDTGGLVEAINLRTVRLRDAAGNVHTIPYSSVAKVTNMTKEYSRYLIEAAVSDREDVDEVIAVLAEVGEEMQRDPEFGPDITEPLEILGLDRFGDSAVVVVARLTTRPLQQWRVGREFNRRMKKAFEARGIELPSPQRTVYLKQSGAAEQPAG